MVILVHANQGASGRTKTFAEDLLPVVSEDEAGATEFGDGLSDLRVRLQDSGGWTPLVGSEIKFRVEIPLMMIKTICFRVIFAANIEQDIALSMIFWIAAPDDPSARKVGQRHQHSAP